MPSTKSTQSSTSPQIFAFPSLDDIFDTGQWRSSMTDPPRPLNVFMLFRLWACRVRQKERPKEKQLQENVSIEIAKSWNVAPPEVQAHFRKLATQLKVRHTEIFPNYRYQPRNKTEKKSSKNKQDFPSFPPKKSQIGSPRISRDGGHPYPRSSRGLREDTTDNMVSTTSIPEEDHSTANPPSVHGPFWVVYPLEVFSDHLEPYLVSCIGPSTVVSPHDWQNHALALNSSDTLALMSRVAHSDFNLPFRISQEQESSDLDLSELPDASEWTPSSQPEYGSQYDLANFDEYLVRHIADDFDPLANSFGFIPSASFGERFNSLKSDGFVTSKSLDTVNCVSDDPDYSDVPAQTWMSQYLNLDVE